jgi:biotin synthase-related radical SAM superfamily protein
VKTQTMASESNSIVDIYLPIKMNRYKEEILNRICCTELVYGKINKKLNLELSKQKIETLISTILSETEKSEFQKKGKNIYITNNERNIRLTINTYTNRIITVDKLNGKKTNH